MRLYRLGSLGSLDALTLTEAKEPQPGPHEVVVRIRACSLNHRDLNIVNGSYGRHPLKPAAIPVSDGAGDVVALGNGVTRWKLGDRVAPIFVQRWLGGNLRLEYMPSALGGPSDGVLAEQIVVNEQGLVRVPPHLSFEEAATLPCAAVTAWNAVFTRGALRPGHTLVTLGTGGVSLFAAQFGLMTGARVIATTGSADKVARLHALGVSDVIDTQAVTQWDARVRELTQGQGADLVVEVGGPGSLAKSIAAIRYCGHISVVGNLAGQSTIDPAALFAKRASACGIQVGSRDMFEDMNRAIEVAKLKPVIDRVFGFEAARSAYEYLASGKHFGKVVIRVP
ncbi:MAG: NAD(P)-dependent alcohol dehydrogenase [Betaproteobacteria bacterium]|nr:MAG: NAD(P)-dependent alcohol dehydrogenase [Betaproteobacteria bacterium]